MDDQILNTIRTALDTALEPIIDNLADTVERLDKIEAGLQCIEDKIDKTVIMAPNDLSERLNTMNRVLDGIKADTEFMHMKTSMNELEINRLKKASHR